MVATLSVAVAITLIMGTVVSTYFAVRAYAAADRALAEKGRADKKADEALAEKGRADEKADEALVIAASERIATANERQAKRDAEEAREKATESLKQEQKARAEGELARKKEKAERQRADELATLYEEVITSWQKTTETSGAVSREYQIKAAFLYNFAKFVDWPDEAFPNEQASLDFGVLGADPFAASLDSLSGKIAKGRTLEIKRLKTAEEARMCHILFISASETNRLAQILETLKGSSVLTVGEAGRFTQLGGIIKFKTVENKVRLEINEDAASRSGLKIPSRLLNVAEITGPTPQGPSPTPPPPRP